MAETKIITDKCGAYSAKVRIFGGFTHESVNHSLPLVYIATLNTHAECGRYLVEKQILFDQKTQTKQTNILII